jgi:diguanylate cyclase (GGDEF)-like protein/PAS domain S-box-containing protein
MKEELFPAELRRLFYLAAEQNSLSIMITDRNGAIVYVNPALEQSTGYAASELLGVDSRIFQSGQTALATYQEIRKALLTGKVWEGELLNRHKDGELCTESVCISPLRAESGQVTHFFAIQQDLSVCRNTARRLESLSTCDYLTGLPNRVYLTASLSESIQEAAALGHELTIIHLDLDRFKSLNDLLGYNVADQVLVGIADRLRGVVRRDDVLARLTGDEFVLLLRNTVQEARLTEALKRVQATISEPLLVASGHEVSLTVSIGVAVYPRDGVDGDSLLRAANLAMYAAKKKGGDNVNYYVPEMQEHIASRFDLASQLRRVVERGELVLYYQPQVSLISGDIVGAEALVRWQHPEKGMIPPGQFIPFAEETGLILPISDWVVSTACQQMRDWRDDGLPFLKIGVNLSARHFHLTSLPDTVAAALADNGIEARYLELELTESAMMHDAAGAVRIMDRLKGLGVRLSLDDFGTGFSSLAYLSRFAIDLIKIDQSFIRDVTDNPVNASIVSATIAMAHKLGKNIIAEGVETEAQMAFLRRHDCDEMQGYLFSRPVPAAEFAALLRERKRIVFDGQQGYGGMRTLLLVDDEPRILSSLKRLFRREGYQVLTANSASEALELLALNRIQVIISDQRMPVMTGIELLSRVKDLYPDTIRIVLSGYSEIETVTEAINRGAIWKYFTKPWEEDKLRDEVCQAFRLVGGPECLSS